MSHIRYGLQVYGNAGRELIKKIEKIVRFAARVISGRGKYEHISDVISQLGWLGVQQLIDYSDLCLLHKVLTTGMPAVLDAHLSFNRDCRDRRTRQSHHLVMPKAKNEPRQANVHLSSQPAVQQTLWAETGSPQMFKAEVQKAHS